MGVIVILPESSILLGVADQQDPAITDDDNTEHEISSIFDNLETSSAADSVELHRQRCPLLSHHRDGEDAISNTTNVYGVPLYHSDEMNEEDYNDYEIPLNDSNSDGMTASNALAIPSRKQRIASLSNDLYVDFSKSDHRIDIDDHG